MTLAPHLWHPMLVHFAVALLVASLLLFVAAYLLRERPAGASALAAAWWNLWLGAGATVLTVAAGLLAYAEIGAHNEGAHAAMEAHRNWALATALPFLALAGWSVRMRRERVALPFVAVLAAATVMLGITGWKGGTLVYNHGVGVAALEKVLLSTRGGDSHGHDDGHAHGAEPPVEADDAHVHSGGSAHRH
ncbi:MAG: DUF2231 domain-containing protein [Inquilinus sp.]|nr:DUF2231 domain-containing protein [Inquilinus sp.]